MYNTKYAIYGVNRVAKDFLYIMDTLDIACFFERYPEKESFLGKPVYPIESLLEKSDKYDRIILCGFTHSAQIKEMEQQGKVYQQDFYLEEDFFENLDQIKINPQKKKKVLWGTGRKANHFLRECSDIKVSKIIDSNPYVDEYNGYTVFRPSQIEEWGNVFVFIAVADDENIRALLESKGMRENEDYVDTHVYETLPSRMLRKTIFDRNEYDLNCITMLNHVEIIGKNGGMVTCCSTFNSMSIGELRSETTKEAWNSTIHRILCLSNVNHTYSFCDKSMCPLFIERNKEETPDLNTPYQRMQQYPTTVAVSHDYSCNLKCITCRNGYRHASKAEMEEIENRSKTIAEEILPHTEFLIAAGDGEVFLSKAYRSIYTHPNMQSVRWLRFLTNGLLFTPERWKELRAVYTGKVMMTVSIDAATKETYEKIRSGGCFDVLQRNMEYAASLRKTGDLAYLRFNFVVQKENYREMPLFVKWGQDLGVDELFFTKILNWGTYSPEEFSEISMMESDGITPKTELEEILNLSEMQSHEVDLGTIRSHHERVLEDTIENYYRWELERKVPGLFAAEGN